MKSNVVSLAVALCATACGGSAVAQPATQPIPQYQVEIIVFAHREFDAGEERFALEQEPVRGSRSDALLELPLYVEPPPPVTVDQPLPGGPAAAPVEDPLSFRLLAPDQLQLNNEYRRLTNLGAYRTLVHAGWVQPGLPEDQAKPFDLTTLGVGNPRGTVRVYLSRFLHVSLDLSYEEGAPAPAAAPDARTELREIALPPRYRLVTERQTRSGELHYFDHPAFGVLVKVTPVATGNPGSTGRRPAA